MRIKLTGTNFSNECFKAGDSDEVELRVIQ